MLTPPLIDQPPADDELFPVLSLAERDRRWTNVRALMDEHDLAAVVVFGEGREQLDRYLAKEVTGGPVILPRDGEPVLAAGFNVMPLLRHDEPGALTERWIDDLRHGGPVGIVSEVLRERRLTRERIGVVGLSSLNPENVPINYPTWVRMLEALPEVHWVDVSLQYERLLLAKSPEEIRLVRRAAQLGEDASRAFLEAAHEGALESAVGAAATHAILSRGGHQVPPGMLLRSGRRWLIGPPEWGYAGGRPHRLRRGDLIGSELFSCYGGYETQQQMHVVIGEPDARQLRLAEVAHRANETGAALARPGARFSEVYAAMHEVVTDAGLWSRGPLVQTVGPVLINGPMIVGAEHQPLLRGLPVPQPAPAEDDFEIEAGMTFAFQACANEGLFGMCLGGTVLIGPDGAEELNTLARTLNVSA